MANLLQFKRRSADTAAPGSLAAGEPAVNTNAGRKTLYVGDGSAVKAYGVALDAANSVPVTKGAANEPVLQALAASQLLGRGDSGDIAAISLGSGLQLSGTTLSAIGSFVTDYKESVRVAATGNVAIATELEDGDTLDGVTLATGDRVLLPLQTDPIENGVYVVAASGAASRATDFDEDAEVTGGTLVPVEEGTVNADTLWFLTTNDPIEVDTDAIAFAKIAGPGELIAGAGLTKTGNTLAVGAGTGVTVNADDVAIGQDVATTADVTFGSVTASDLTPTRVLFAGASGLITDDAGMTYVAGTDTLTVGVLDGATVDGGSY